MVFAKPNFETVPQVENETNLPRAEFALSIFTPIDIFGTIVIRTCCLWNLLDTNAPKSNTIA